MIPLNEWVGEGAGQAVPLTCISAITASPSLDYYILRVRTVPFVRRTEYAGGGAIRDISESIKSYAIRLSIIFSITNALN